MPQPILGLSDIRGCSLDRFDLKQPARLREMPKSSWIGGWRKLFEGLQAPAAEAVGIGVHREGS